MSDTIPGKALGPLAQFLLSSKERLASAARYHGSREGLIARLNGGDLLPAGLPRPAEPTAPDDAEAGPLRAVIYLRVSTEEQAKVGGTAEGYSIPYQRRACREEAEKLGAVVVEEYVDLGESAKSSRRPELQRMLRELTGRGVTHVIVHKTDRLARNTRDDYEITTAIAAAGAELISVSERFDNTPSGKLNRHIQTGVAQFHIDNLCLEVMKGLTMKVESGGTPYRAPMGYLNKQEITDNIVIRTVEVDPERAPLVRWTFAEYATGSWTLLRLRQALTDKGFRTRTTAKNPAKPITVNGLYQLLCNPYYMGVVPYRGAYHDGTHPALVDAETWLQVQAVLAAHNTAGEKDRRHPHYLKGSIWCGGCGGRLVYSRNTGRRGGTYEYFVCLNRHAKRRPCGRRYLPVSAVEAGVENFYTTFRIAPQRAEAIRDSVLAELAAEREQAAADQDRASRRLANLTNQRKAVLQAHYAEALPLDLLKEEMDRLTREMIETERLIHDAAKTVDQLDATLQQALTVASRCHEYYQTAPPHVRRQINQGFFTKLLIGQDGSVAHGELTEPFATLLAGKPGLAPGGAQGASEAPDGATVEKTPTSTPKTFGRVLGDDRRRPTDVLVKTSRSDQETGGDLVTAGSKEASLVPAMGFEPTLSTT